MMSKLTTVNEIKTALSIGCKVRHSNWLQSAYLYLEGAQLFTELHEQFLPLKDLEILMTRSGHWEIYHEHEGSTDSPKDRV